MDAQLFGAAHDEYFPVSQYASGVGRACLADIRFLSRGPRRRCILLEYMHQAKLAMRQRGGRNFRSPPFVSVPR